MVTSKNIFLIFLASSFIACGVKKTPTPRYTIPETALAEKPTPSPTPSER